MFTYQKTNRYFAQFADSLEPVGADELAELGGKDIKTVYRGAYFTADKAALYRIVYQTRLSTRILAQLLRFDCHSTKYLYKTARKIDWDTLFGPATTFAVDAITVNSKIKHSQYAALCLKDAIVDHFRESTGKRPNVDTDNPDLLLNLHIDRNKATVSIDTSGGSLHRRGYRKETVEAPMQETVAAAIIRLTSWLGERPLIDPMCGSGTLLAEAYMHAARIPAGYLRKRFGLPALPDYDQQLWQQTRKQGDKAIKKLAPKLISGSDISKQAVQGAATNLAMLPGGNAVHLATRRMQSIEQITDSVIVINPPYGIRLEKGRDMGAFIKEIGDFLKQRCTGSSAFIYLGDRTLAKSVGLKPAWKKPLKNGGLDGVLLKYDLY
ncbi:MAG: THUMP domain-containing protein [Desulfobulbaceae bacterium]|nr:THUMP domain-containing protein [Desulfobulbaceae bacterium]